MADQATAKYLADNVGDVLAKALSEMATSQPSDGVDFLSRWLKTYAEQEEAKAFAERERAALEDARRERRQQSDEKERRKQKKVAEVKKKDDMYSMFMQKLQDEETMFDDTMWLEMANVAKTAAEASDAYIGLLDEEGLTGIEGEAGVPVIIYKFATDGSIMTEQIMRKPEDPEVFGCGLTFGALTQTPPEEETRTAMRLWKQPVDPPPPPPADGEDPPPEELPPYLPVRVDCVTDEDRVKYFDMMRLGAYLAVPVSYKSYYIKDAFDDAREFQRVKREEDAKREADAAERQRLIDEEQEIPPELEEPTEPVPEKKMELRDVEVKMVLCVDTLGKNTAFTDTQVIKLMDMCKAVCECKSRTEIKQVDQQGLVTLNEEFFTEAKETIDQVKREVEEALMEQKEAEEAELEEDEAERFEKKFDYLRARNAFIELKDMVMELKNCVYAPPEVCNTVAGLALLFLYTAESVYYLHPKKQAKLSWEQLKKDVLDEVLFATIGDDRVSLEGERTGLQQQQKLVEVQKMLPEPFAEENAMLVPPGFEIVRNLLQAAIEYRKSDVALRKSRYERRKKEAEEADEPFSEKTPAELDDDAIE